jgi:hypothetical protein
MVSTAAEPAKLDELMLAMDIVDTLRHQQDMVDLALSEYQRDAALVARIRSIYADQGIEVSDAIIVEGVEALKKDRFVYQAPPPGFSLRLARLYVNRGRWAKRIVSVAVIALAGWLVYDIQGDLAQRGRTAEARGIIEKAQSRIAALDQRLVQARRAGETAQVADNVQAIGQRLRSASFADIGRAEQAIAQARTIAAAAPDAATVTDPVRVQQALAPIGAPLDEAEQALGRADTALAELRGINDLAGSLARARGVLADADLAADVGAQIDDLQRQAEQALAAGDLPLARGRIDRLLAMGETINQSYELRIVSRPNVQSGVWRHPVDNSGARNYYIIVDAIGADGRPFDLPITSEEDQATRRVSTFGIRVPEAVYERVRADKQDNGLIDTPLFGEKRRGELEPRYRFAVDGGAITDW